MSYLTIVYLDNTQETYNTTAVDIVATNKFIVLKKTDVETHYIPLCNIKKLEVDGAYKTIKDE